MERAHVSTERTKLIAARLEKGLSQKQVADRLHVDHITVARWEKGEHAPQSYYLDNLCHILEKTALELGLIDEHLVVSQASMEEPEDDTQDSYSKFRASNLTLRLWHTACNWRFHARYQDLQAFIVVEVEDNISMNPDDSVSRREALKLLAGLPIEICGLSVQQPVFQRSHDEIITHCAAGVTACWYLRKGKDLRFASDTVSKYLPTLKAITTQGTAPQRKAAADLLAQGLLLKAHLAKHVTNTSDAIRYAQQAEKYSEQAENPLLQIIVLTMQDAAHYYANHHDQALYVSEKAKYLLDISPTPLLKIAHSLVSVNLATDKAYHGQKDDALAMLNDAYATFYAQSPDDRIPVWMRHSEGNLLINDGLMHFYLGLYEKAFMAFDQISQGRASSEVQNTHAIINQAMTEAIRDDRPRDMDKCIKLWKQGITGAKVLNSEEWLNESVNTYKVMRAAWPHEKKVKDLREHVLH